MFSLKFSESPTVARLRPCFFQPLPLGAVRPTGWLHDQLRVQAEGLSGHLDEFWQSVAGSRWIGGEHEGWERGPYWLDGLVPLAVLLDDPRLLAKAQGWIDYILAHQHEDGWFGPKDDPHEGTGEVTLDPWPQFILFKVFTQWQEGTNDERIIPAMLRGAHRIARLLSEKPLTSWARVRWADLSLSLYWLYERTSERWLLDLAAMAHDQGFSWQEFYDDFPATGRTDAACFKIWPEERTMALHGVNNAMGVKSGAVWSRQSGDAGDAWSSLHAVETLDIYHGQVTGMFSGDEHLAGRDPIQGTETCTVTEYLFTLEQMLAITGDTAIADRLERVAFNALPAALTKDMCGRQYDQQPNQVLCDRNRRVWVSNNADSNLFSLEGNFGCCTANFHQGWPKFVASLWMQPGESEGLVAALYGPSVVSTVIAGTAVTVEEETQYPFRGEIRFRITPASPVAFPLYLRVPEWAAGATVTVNNEPQENATAGGFHGISRVWQTGDTVTLRLPMTVRREKRGPQTIGVLRGPLVMALRIGERFEQVGGTLPYADWAIHPTTPWNYALLGEDEESFALRQAPITAQPFDAKCPPVVVTVAAKRLPEWEMAAGSAAFPARFMVPDDAAQESVELVPYGSTHLRISEFPVTTVSAKATPTGAPRRNGAGKSRVNSTTGTPLARYIRRNGRPTVR